MGRVNIERIWDGGLSPITMTVDGTPYSIGLTAAQWQRPMAAVCQSLTAAIEAAVQQGAAVTVASDGKIRIACDAYFDIEFQPGFAAYWGFASTTYTNVQEPITSTNPTYLLADQWVKFRLPIRSWHRAIGHRTPVVWSDGTDFSFDVTWTTYKFGSTPPYDPRRVPHVVYGGDTSSPWGLSNRDGYVTLRPLPESCPRSPLGGSSADWGSYSYRATWLNQTIEV